MGRELLRDVLRWTARAPEDWKGWSPERAFEFLRERRTLSQSALARAAGMSQAQVSRLEGGEDALLSSWRRLYAAMGFELLIVPVAASARELDDERAKRLQGDRWRYVRCRPRRRWLKLRKEKAPEPEAPGPSDAAG